MPTGAPALAIAIIVGVAFAAVIVRLGRNIPPQAGAGEQAWRSGWLTGILPFGRLLLAPKGPPEPAHTEI